MTELTWNSDGTDWDAATSESNVHHEAPTGTSWAGDTHIEQGYPSALGSYFSATPLAYYPLEESSGASTANEVTGNGTDGTYSGPTTGNAGILGFNAPTYDGTDDYVDTGSEYTSTADAMGISAWVKKSAWSTSYENVVNNWDGSNGGARLQRDSSNNYLRFAIDGKVVTSSTDVADGAWHHVHGQGESGGTYSLWIDGVQDGTGSSGATEDTAASTANHWIGSQPDDAGNGSNFWDGQIAEVIIWDGTLGSGEIETLADPTAGRLIGAGATS